MWYFLLYLYAASAAAQQTASVGGSQDLTPIQIPRLDTLFSFPDCRVVIFNQKRRCTQSLSGLLRISHQSNLLAWTVCSQVPSRKVVRARDPPLRSTKGGGGVCGGQSVSRLPQGRDVLARQAV